MKNQVISLGQECEQLESEAARLGELFDNMGDADEVD